jgi:hypothetical protein
MKKDKPYYQLIPQKIRDELPKIENQFKKIPGYSPDRLNEIISIIAKNLRKAEDSEEDKKSWATLKMEYLRKVVPNADDYLKILRKNNVIERFGSYKKGQESYKYRFAKHIDSVYITVELENQALLNRIKKFRTVLGNCNSKKYPVQNKYLKKLTVEPLPSDFIDKNFANDRKKNFAHASITRIVNGEIFHTVDSTSGRYHSNLTILPKELRQFLRIDNIPLINIDIRNSQPFLSSLLLDDPQSFAAFTKNKYFSKMLETLQIKDTEDVRLYYTLARTGNLYEYLQDQFAKSGYKRDRDEIKKRLLKIMFANNSHTISGRSIFKELFPEVSRIFEIIRGNEKGDKFQAYNRFSILLQRVESHLMLERILKRINSEHPEIVTLTIHDSMMTKNQPEHIEIVKRIIEDEILKCFGVKPLLKEEY